VSIQRITPCWQCGHDLQDPSQVHYCDYISLGSLLQLLVPHASSAQARGFAHPDEVQFLLIHQMFEIAFQLHIHELRRVIGNVSEGNFADASHGLERVTRLTRLYPSILSMMMTMTPGDFAQFRGKLSPASGAESEASRVIELLSGITEDTPYVSFGGRSYTFRQTLDQAPSAEEGRPKTRWWTPHLSEVANEANLASCFEAQRLVYSGTQDMGRLEEMLFEYDLSYRRYRLAHLGIAVHQIGTQAGTGHTAGGGYLRSVADTARFFPNLFPDRWEQAKHSHQ
jgi:tryptophan 2,3-dioxygenase